MEPIINWKALSSINRPPMPEPPPKNGENMWNKAAAMYNKMSALEREMTLNQVNAMPLFPDATVVDFGCGCGRLTVPIAGRVKAVTAVDSAENMLDNCIANVKAAGCTNVTPVSADFLTVTPDVDIPLHDIAICSRSTALWHLDKLSAFAKKYVAIVIWANAPSIPKLLGGVFAGTGEDERKRPHPPEDRRVGYNAFWNTAYDMGYEPNCHIVEDGFKAVYSSIDEACQDLRILGDVASSKEDVYRSNVEKYLTKREDGKLEFFLKTRSAVIWWETHPEIF